MKMCRHFDLVASFGGSSKLKNMGITVQKKEKKKKYGNILIFSFSRVLLRVTFQL
jgi:hypothetical protein